MNNKIKIRLFCIMALIYLLGCSDTQNIQTLSDVERESITPITLKNLVYVDPSSTTTQHPLVCGLGRDFPLGRQLEFRNSKTEESLLAVFPESKRAPRKSNGSFVLHGHFQGIQNKENYTFKNPGIDYRYFVVSAWAYEK